MSLFISTAAHHASHALFDLAASLHQQQKESSYRHRRRRRCRCCRLPPPRTKTAPQQQQQQQQSRRWAALLPDPHPRHPPCHPSIYPITSGMGAVPGAPTRIWRVV